LFLIPIASPIVPAQKKVLSLIVFGALVAVTAAVGAQFEPGAWYEGLTKPAWNPPNWVFAVANGLWSWLFFGLHEPALALIDIVVLLALIVSFIALARRHSVAASWLFAPYAAWVAFAAALNAAIWQAN
jgi:tryptophan-rich sensory protein